MKILNYFFIKASYWILFLIFLVIALPFAYIGYTYSTEDFYAFIIVPIGCPLVVLALRDRDEARLYKECKKIKKKLKIINTEEEINSLDNDLYILYKRFPHLTASSEILEIKNLIMDKMAQKKQKREFGYYWVKDKQSKEWEIALYYDFSDEWWRIGAEFPDKSSFFEEINEKRITKEDE